MAHLRRPHATMDEIEHEFACPFCGEPISMLLDLSVDRQDYVEDCEVCCRPIQVHYRAQTGRLVSFSAERGH
jgi:hypothetical protein